MKSWLSRTLMVIAVAITAISPAVAKPARIVSLNLCTDQLLIALAERRNITVPLVRGVMEEISS